MTRRDPDAHLGPRAQQANREQRVDLALVTAIVYLAPAAVFLFIAARRPDVLSIMTASIWVLVAGGGIWHYRRTRRREGSLSKEPEGPEGGA